MTTTAGVVERRGSALHYWLTGPTDGAVVACIHGASLDHRTFDAQIGVLTDAGFRVLTLDMRGHGLSKPLGAAFTVSNLAADLAAVLDHVGCESAVVLGHSMDRYVAQEFVHEFPQRTRALVVVGATDLSKMAAAAWRLLYKVSRCR